MQKYSILVTGAAGFIGFHLVRRLLSESFNVIGLDNINDYYDVRLKFSRLGNLGINESMIRDNIFITSDLYQNFKFIKADITNHDFIIELMTKNHFDVVVNLAAQAGVRFSIDNPQQFTLNNINGFLSILEGCRKSSVSHLVYASSSSVYGLTSNMPLDEKLNTDSPISLYAATKKSNELMAFSYSHLYNFRTTGLRFFTVYGPWGRPDMVYFKFTESILNELPITVYNSGTVCRDFTYIDDIIESLYRVISITYIDDKRNGDVLCDANGKSGDMNNYSIFNIGNSSPIYLSNLIDCIENSIGKKAIVEYKEMPKSDVPFTHANTDSLQSHIQYTPSTVFKDGIARFIDWYLKFHKEK